MSGLLPIEKVAAGAKSIADVTGRAQQHALQFTTLGSQVTEHE